jgi:conjugative relaxase-like TrwC/TraI family protein
MAIRRGFAGKIESVEYFYVTEADAAKAKALGLGSGELDAAGERRDYVQYLSGGDNDAGAGELVVYERPIPADAPIYAQTFISLSPLAGLTTGQKATGGLMRDLCAGKNPKTQEVALAGRKYKGKTHNPGGFDLQSGVNKSVSLAAIFDKARAAGIRDAERQAYDQAMAWGWDKGLFATRVTREGKTFYEPARKMVMAVYRHSTSRAEDPHDHHHGAVMAMCERLDGSLGTLSNYLLKLYGGAIQAHKKCTEAGLLRKLGYAVEIDPNNPRDYRLAGVDQKLVELFSKRRAMIEAAAERAGINTSVERAAAQMIAFDTRADKRFTDAAELEARWERELASAGYTRESFVFALEHAAREQAAKRPQEKPEQRVARLETLVMNALSELQRDRAAFTRATLYRVAFEALQCDVDDGAEAARIVEHMERDRRLVLLADRSGEPIYTTDEMITMERDTLVIAWRGRGQGPKIPAASIEAVLNRIDAELKAKHGPDAGLKDEQKRAVRHALGGDQVTATQGYAGTGKSFITAIQREIVEAQGYRVIGTAPSWKATDVLRTDCGLRAENCVVLAKLSHDYRAGKLTFDDRSYIILDEAGMVSARDMRELMQIARDTGASVRLQGDKGQFRAVDAGQPFAALQRLLGAAELRDILRQKTDWQRAASVALDDANNSAHEADAQTKIRQALQAYDDAGRIVWVDDDEAAFAAAVDQMMQWRTEHPGESTAIVTEWNGNARAASALLRERLKATGQVAADEIELQVIVRGSGDNKRASPMAFAAGDEIIFGENVVLPVRTLRNNDLARVVSIDNRDAANPLFRFRMEDGHEIEARYAALVGRREDGEIAAPRIQHSYVMTAHSSQGATYARTIELAIEGHGREAALVTTTRHRIDHVKVIATDRLADGLESKRASTLELEQGGAIRRAAEDDDERPAAKKPPPMPPPPRSRPRRAADSAQQERERQEREAAEERAALEAIKEAYFAECARHDAFGNISDFYADIHAFAGVEKPQPTRPAAIPAPMAAPLLEQRVAAVGKATKQRRFGREVAPPSLAKPSPPTEPPRSRVTEDERAQMRQVNLVTFAIDRLGGKLVEKWSGGEAAHVAFGERDVVAIAHKDGWIWSPKQGGKGGGIYDLVARVKSLSYGEALHWLRQELRTERPRSTAAPSAIAKEKGGVGPAHVLDEQTRRRFLGWWENLKTIGDQAQRWLVERRAIPADVLAMFSANVRGELSGPKAQNRFGSAFAHRDEDLRLTTIARRGPDGFNRYAAGGLRGLFQAGDLSRPRRVYVTETAIDSLSLFVFDRQPASAALLATDGSFHEKAREIIIKRAREWRHAEWHIGQDNDEPHADPATGELYIHGHRQRDAVIAAIREGDPSATIVVRDPGEDYKDWNDRLRGVEFSKIAMSSQLASRQGTRPTDRPSPAAAPELRDPATASTAQSPVRKLRFH